MAMKSRRSGPAQAFLVGIGLLAVIVLALALWQVRWIVLLGFGAILAAILLNAAAWCLRRVLPMGQVSAVILSVTLLILVGVAAFILLGAQIVSGLLEIQTQIPEVIRTIDSWIDLGDVESWIGARMDEPMQMGSVFSGLTSATSILIALGTGIALVFVGGVYLALNPEGYRDGALALAPAHLRPRLRQTMAALVRALRAWLVGQLVAMFAVFGMTTVGLWLLGVSTPIALGAIAGLLEFVPYVGPLTSAVPAVAVGIMDGPTTALWVILLYFAVQQIEGALLIPLIQREAVDLPPAITVFSIVGLGVLLGPLGVILAAPLTVVGVVLARELWCPWMAARGAEEASEAAE
ncbi:AI-2E family transporter [Marinovum algicola]|uniref:AI-2E family transporter n=1 Tax=Marinovum algicola TaxID=42444 RepID=UPI0024B9DDB4|nr:AI-2E family transporter [Marinovum algicola]